MFFLAKPMDLDDRLLHYLLISIGLGVGVLLKEGIQTLAAKFWDTEYSQFRRWKKAKRHRKPQRKARKTNR